MAQRCKVLALPKTVKPTVTAQAKWAYITFSLLAVVFAILGYVRPIQDFAEKGMVRRIEGSNPSSGINRV
jgi:hypothetical protein